MRVKKRRGKVATKITGERGREREQKTKIIKWHPAQSHRAKTKTTKTWSLHEAKLDWRWMTKMTTTTTTTQNMQKWSLLPFMDATACQNDNLPFRNLNVISYIQCLVIVFVLIFFFFFFFGIVSFLLFMAKMTKTTPANSAKENVEKRRRKRCVLLCNTLASFTNKWSVSFSLSLPRCLIPTKTKREKKITCTLHLPTSNQPTIFKSMNCDK